MKLTNMSTTNNYSIIDLRNGTNHPCSFLYSEIYENALLTGKFIDGRSQPGFNLESEGGNSPFVLAAKAAIVSGVENKDSSIIIENVLSRYYATVIPKSAAQYLDLDVDTNNKLAISPPWASVFPWRARTLESYQQAYENAAIEENRKNGTVLDITKGWLFCGPVSPEKIKIEAMRIDYVLKQINKEGFKRSDSSDGDVKATALIDDSNNWRWLITAGNHRASAASALGYKDIPIRINLVIRRNDYKYWPNVTNGLYSESDALKVFDRYFNGIAPPALTNKWLRLKLINENKKVKEGNDA